MQDNLSELEYLERLYCSEKEDEDNLNWNLNHQEDVYRDREFNT